MKLCVGLVTRDRIETISICLNALRNQTMKPNEIIIIDTSTNNKTKMIAKKCGLPVKYIKLKENVKQPAARNMLLEKTKSDIIAFLDDDAIPEKGWLENIVKGYSFSNNIAGVTGPAINSDINLNPIVKINMSKKNQNFVTSYGDIREKNRCWIPPHPVKCQVMLGANMSFRVRELRLVGGFVNFYSEGYGFREENFPQMSLIKRGLNFVYMPKAFVWHIKAKKGGSDRDFEHYYLCGKNHRYFADCFFPKWKSRLSWIFWSVSPPCMWLCFILAISRKNLSILKWHRGLWNI